MPAILLKELPPPPAGKTGWPWTDATSSPLKEIPTNERYPGISVVTPSYNQGSFLEETIRSVLLQAYPGLEFIIIDGGSTDNSVDIIRKYEPWITYWVSEPDAGQTYAINKGIQRATGDILSWLNSDDILCPGALQRVAEQFAGIPEVDLVYGDCEMIDDSGNVFSRFDVRIGDLAGLLEENFISQPSAFFSRRALDAAGGLDSELHYAMDYDLWIRMFLKKMKVCYDPAVLSRFRYHTTSKSGVKSVQFGYEVLNLLDKIDKAMDRSMLPALLQAYHRTFGTIIDLHRQTASNEEVLHNAVIKLLGIWVSHIERHYSFYAAVPRLLAQSYYTIGNHYCLMNHVHEGRRYFARACRADSAIKGRGFFAWFMTFFGAFPFKWYYRDEAADPKPHCAKSS